MKEEKAPAKTKEIKVPVLTWLISKAVDLYHYFMTGVWEDTRMTKTGKFIRTASLSVKTFFNANLQVRASALTYKTLLAIVPALAMMLAIGRGFGLQDIITRELYDAFPAQNEALTEAFKFVESYLSTASGGWFVGVGLVALLWTLISLFNSVEGTFNVIWGVKRSRSWGHRLMVYIALLIVFPVLIICTSGLSLLATETVQTILSIESSSRVVSIVVDLISTLLTCLFFVVAFTIIPNTKVKFKNAIVAGSVTGIAFIILQWLFITGQMSVSRYNAIYGSFAFIPLFLIWTQFTWMITLTGALICYASQNIYVYTHDDNIAKISMDYKRKVTLAVLAVIAQRFDECRKPLTIHNICDHYSLPIRLVGMVTNDLIEAGLLRQIVVDDDDDEYALMPAIPTSKLTLGYVLDKFAKRGEGSFVSDFDRQFSNVIEAIDNISDNAYRNADSIMLTDLKIDNLTNEK